MSRTTTRIRINHAENAMDTIADFMKRQGYQPMEYQGKMLWCKDTFPIPFPILPSLTVREHLWDITIIRNEIIAEDFLWAYNRECAANANLFSMLFMHAVIVTLCSKRQHKKVINFLNSL